MKHTAFEMEQDLIRMEDSSFMDLDFTLSEENLEYIIEGYVGKTKECKEIESLFADMKRKYFPDGENTLLRTSFTDLNDSVEKKAIERQLEKLTGFGEVHILIFNDNDVNAMTCPQSLITRSTSSMPSLPTAHGERYYDASHSYFCYIKLYSGLIAELTPGEITAFVLHEIGHNFDHTLTAYLFEVIIWGESIVAGPFTMLCNLFRAQISYVNDLIVKLLDYTKIFPLLKNVVQNVNRFIGMALGPLGKSTKIGLMALNGYYDPIGTALGGIRFQQEAFADSYTTAMGYGPEMISAMDKLDQRDVITHHGVIPEFWTGFGSGALCIMLMLCDPHPEEQTRCKLILEAMEDVAKDPTVPRSMRKQVLDEYKRTQKAYDAFVEADPDHRNAVITRFTRELKDNFFGGKVDFRSWIYNLTNPERATNGMFH